MNEYSTSTVTHNENDTHALTATNENEIVVQPEEEKEYRVMPKWYAYGHDFGNAEIGGVLLKPILTPKDAAIAAKGPQILTRSIPTAFAKVNPLVLRNMGVDMADMLYIKMKGETATFGIGKVALTQSVDQWNGRGDAKRYASKESLEAVLAISASLIPDVEYNLVVVTGLPAETYMKNSALRKDIKTALTGKWTFMIDGKTWRTCTIEVAGVVMEGAGALVTYGHKSVGVSESAIIDIGGRTTDLYVARGAVAVTELCKGKAIGVQTATDMMMESFENMYGVPLSALESHEIMHAYAAGRAVAREAEENAAKEEEASGTPRTTKRGGKKAKVAKDATEYPVIMVNGEAVPTTEIDALVNEAVTYAGGQIVSFVSQAWRQSDSSDAIAARFSPVLNIGGGVHYFYDFLKKRIPHLAKPSDAIFANAKGYAQSAARLIEKREQKAKA